MIGMMEDLSPCPFCGDGGPVSDHSNREDPNTWRWWVFCPECEATTRDQDTYDEAVAAWNRRPEATA